MNSLYTITAIKAFSDNYIWAITNKSNNSTALVDPGDAKVCIDFLKQHQLSLSAILITHHHPDHTGGIEELIVYCQQQQCPLTIYGPANEVISHCDVKLIENDLVNLPELNISMRVIDVPGHTFGHIAYFSESDTQSFLFCGDTLFSGGCGRLFEGSPTQMLNSLTKLANLPETTKVYCAHEYTQANLNFALTVEPQNDVLINYNNQVRELREKDISTIPTSIKIEKQINPFLRCAQLSVQASAKDFSPSTKSTELDTFTTIRRWKDQF